MAQVPQKLPTYRKHSSRDKAFVAIKGKRRYLPGAYDSPESRAAYGEILKQLATGSLAPEPPAADKVSRSSGKPSIRLAELVERWLDDLKATGQTSEYTHARGLVGMITGEDARRPADRFGPRKLTASRARMVKAGWSRKYINDQVQRLRRMFRWGVEQELLPADVWQTLLAVRGLKKGRSEAAEPRDVKPAPLRSVGGAIRVATPTLATMMKVQYRTGMRPHHVCSLRACEIDFTSAEGVWIYRPQRHEKGRAKDLVIAIGPRSQKLLRPFLDRDEERFLFSPRDACAQLGRKPGPNIRDYYDTCIYRQAVQRACVRAGVPKFFPHQLRHSAGTNARLAGGLEAAQAVLGHDRMQVTEIYAEKDLKLASEIARKIG